MLETPILRYALAVSFRLRLNLTNDVMTLKSTRFSFIIAISIIGLLNTFLEVSLWWLVLPCSSFTVR